MSLAKQYGDRISAGEEVVFKDAQDSVAFSLLQGDEAMVAFVDGSFLMATPRGACALSSMEGFPRHARRIAREFPRLFEWMVEEMRPHVPGRVYDELTAHLGRLDA